MTTKREYAREEPLPLTEVDVLKSLTKRHQRFCRAKQLFDAGWTLQAIGNAFDPPLRRSTIQYWVNQGDLVHRIDVPIPKPKSLPVQKGYQRKRPVSPGIPFHQQERLRQLSPLARLFRSGMASTSTPAIANAEFDALVHELYDANVTISEIARASGVTNRAIARRLGK